MKGKQPSVAEKYDYLYSPEELAGLAETVQRFQGQVQRVYTKFNNNNRDYPIKNALAFCQLLGQTIADLEALRREFDAVQQERPRPHRARLPYLPPQKPKQEDLPCRFS